MLLLISFAPVAFAQNDSAPQGKVIFSSGQAGQTPGEPPNVFPKVPVTNAERAAVVITSDDLDLHLAPESAREEVHALLTLRNSSNEPLRRIPLQISSTLRWLSLDVTGQRQKTPFTQSLVATDADHTGYAQEAVLTLDKPLAPGAALMVSAFFAGEIPSSTARLELLGTPREKATETDWDEIAATSDEGSTGLRGFGEVLWYPVAAPTALLGDGNRLFELIGHQRALNAAATISLRLTVVYDGDPPNGVIFDGKLQPLTKLADDQNQVVDNTHGVATADFARASIGFRTPSLFLTAQEVSQTASSLLSVVSPVPEASDPYAAATETLKPLFTDWIGPTPLTPLLILEHAGAPFEDGGFIAAHLSASVEPEAVAPELVRGVAHSFFNAPAATSAWLNEGLPEFMSLLWTERLNGRDAAIAQLQQNAVPIALAEPDLEKDAKLAGSPLIHAEADVYLHLKSAAVLWQLRDIVGEEALRGAIAAYRHSLQLSPGLDQDPHAFQKSLEASTKLDLAWFFDDWVYHDRGLPDLTVTQVNPRPVLGKGGHGDGYLVVVEVRNDGFAAAEVPITIGTGSIHATARLRVAGRSSATTRIRFQGNPDALQVNDGSVPELRASVHKTAIKIEAPTP